MTRPFARAEMGSDPPLNPSRDSVLNGNAKVIGHDFSG
jgi:hypothetical protein